MASKKKPQEERYVIVVYDTEQHKFSSLSPRLVGEAIARQGWLTRLNKEASVKAVLKDGMEVVERVLRHATVVGKDATKHFFMVWGHDFSLKRRLGRSDFVPGSHLTATFGEENGLIIQVMIDQYFPELAKKVG